MLMEVGLSQPEALITPRNGLGWFSLSQNCTAWGGGGVESGVGTESAQ